MEPRGKWTVEAVSPTGQRFSHSLDRFRMAKLVAQSLIDHGYFDVVIVTEDGRRMRSEEIVKPDFKL